MIARSRTILARLAAPSLLALSLGLGSHAAATPHALAVAGMGEAGLVYDGGRSANVYFDPAAFGLAPSDGTAAAAELTIASVRGPAGVSLSIGGRAVVAIDGSVPLLRLSLLATADNGVASGAHRVEVTFENARTGRRTTAEFLVLAD